MSPRRSIGAGAPTTSAETSGARAPLIDVARRGYHIVYRAGQANHCPGCSGRHWLIGRFSAECAICATAIPLAAASLLPRHAPIFVHRSLRKDAAVAA